MDNNQSLFADSNDDVNFKKSMEISNVNFENSITNPGSVDVNLVKIVTYCTDENVNVEKSIPNSTDDVNLENSGTNCVSASLNYNDGDRVVNDLNEYTEEFLDLFNFDETMDIVDIAREHAEELSNFFGFEEPIDITPDVNLENSGSNCVSASLNYNDEDRVVNDLNENTKELLDACSFEEAMDITPDVNLENSGTNRDLASFITSLQHHSYNDEGGFVHYLGDNIDKLVDVFRPKEINDLSPDKSWEFLKFIIKEGEADEYPSCGDKVSVHFSNWLLRPPYKFESNRGEEKLEFYLGQGMVLKGWDLGISTMKKDENAVFLCQPNYAYGKRGHPPTIAPDTPLLFEIELYGWRSDDLSPKKDNSIMRKVLEKGEGNTFPNEGSSVRVKLIKYLDDQYEMESEFTLGEGDICGIPEGIETALLKFRLNEKSLIYLKNKYILDVAGISGEEEEVKFEVTLLSFNKAKDIWDMSSDEKFEKAELSKEKGIWLYKNGCYEPALKQLKWIIICLENEPGVSPDSEESRKLLLLSGYINSALCYLKLENSIDAIKMCDKALAIDPKNEKALFRRGQAKVQLNQCEGALQDFHTLSMIYPEKAARKFLVTCQHKIKKQKLETKKNER